MYWDIKFEVWEAEDEGITLFFSDSDVGNTTSYSPDGRYAIFERGGNNLKICRREDLKTIAKLSGHSDRVLASSYSPDGQYVVSCSRDKTLKLWSATKGEEILSFPVDFPGNKINFKANGREIILTSSRNIYILRLENLPIGPPILTPWHSDKDGTYAFGCVFCRKWSVIGEEELGTEIDCPECGKRVKLNPFTIDADWRPIAKGWGGGHNSGTSSK